MYTKKVNVAICYNEKTDDTIPSPQKRRIFDATEIVLYFICFI